MISDYKIDKLFEKIDRLIEIQIDVLDYMEMMNEKLDRQLELMDEADDEETEEEEVQAEVQQDLQIVAE